ncbi:lysine N(6)-hydroxylase/L-ornithine N(5)-oxygenase family protein [Pseudoalteromonas sp. R3]|uniref:lysine N(6)-hydroxylase/L-ornithine N(5)-oxygenase family protein n=1 Tax=Pseudoalteromonas sp. R3 TaxID=1709477 RepID=UPI0006B68714|nr:lysine N(6)-hydroxylase/L-ornithine N(5)-oxygenase family protein [Pseudoalteromonas sp. R3]AZZ99754.1 ornithine monooxygenase [Pseudoalteromonas sp. R3]
MKLYDVIGIGFGPANLALAIALKEQNKLSDRVCFIEKQPDFLWHGGMLLDNTDMQISFLKDLVSLRNPTSHFSFINYLHNQNRLDSFINLKTFYPSRHEFNDYLRWSASHFRDHCHFGEQVNDVEPIVVEGKVDHLKVTSRDAEGNQSVRLTKNLVVSVGGSAKIPAPFDALKDSNHVWHSSQYLHNKHKVKAGDRVAIIGAGQSGAEIFADLENMTEQPQVDLIMRAGAMKPADSSPFVNEIFDPAFTDVVFDKSPEQKDRYFNEFRSTNYSVVDEPLINSIYASLYDQKLKGGDRLAIRHRTSVNSAAIDSEGKINLELEDVQSRGMQQYDHLILATGYQYPSRSPLLEQLAEWLKPDISRYYQIETADNFMPKVFTQGVNEQTHGISDSLLSVLAVRSAEIVEALDL